MKNRLVDNDNMLGKSGGITLYHHTQHVINELEELLNNNFAIKKYINFFEDINITPEIIDNIFSIIVSYHDLGKSHSKWQTHCKNNTLINVELRHEIVYLFKIIKNIRKLTDKSKDLINIKDYLDYGSTIHYLIFPILAHHSNLSIDKFVKINNTFDYLDNKYKDLLSKEGLNISDFLMRLYTKISNPYSYNNYNIWYRQAFFRYYLQLADKRASILESDDTIILPNFEKFTYNNKFENLRYLQEIIIENADKSILLVRGNTGGGKSLGAILWGKYQIDNGFADRIVIAMPTRFTTNALSKSVSEYVGGVKIQYGNSKKLYENEIDYKWARSLQSSLTVCTIDFLLNSMTLCKEEMQHTLYNLTNSCLVIDEADFYDMYVQSNIIELINFLTKLKVKILIMSATLPDSFVELLAGGIEDQSIKNSILENGILDDISDNDRKRINIENIIESESEYNLKLSEIVNKKTAIIYCNTIERVRYVYDYLKDKVKDSKRIVMYHSELKQCDKTIIESEILNKIGEEAWKNNTADGIIIMSQIGELSINISSDYILTDICPIDRLVQRFGRGARFHFLKNRICIIDIVIPQKNSEYYPAPYGNYNMKERSWDENIYMSKTRELLRTGSYNFKDYLEMVNMVYYKLEIDTESKNNSNKLKKLNNDNIIFNRNIKIEDDINLNDWQARNINPSAKIYIGEPKEFYNNYDSWLLDYENNSINIAYYKFYKWKDKYIFPKTIKIKNDTIIVCCLSDCYYINKWGIDINTSNVI